MIVESLALFWGAFLAATFVPFFSEIGLASLVLSMPEATALWFTVATTGNTLGSVVNWAIGRFLGRVDKPRWWPVSEKDMRRGEVWFDRYGKYSLLLAFAPVIGDPITFVAGLLRVPFWTFLILVAISKGGRYAVVIALTMIGSGV